VTYETQNSLQTVHGENYKNLDIAKSPSWKKGCRMA